tara:strand:+ start:1111 stop:1500 length:390 start_codon:yes stop_codon:yes gene_type:complete
MIVRVDYPQNFAWVAGWALLFLLDCLWLSITKLDCFVGYASLRKGVPTSMGVGAVAMYTFVASLAVSTLTFSERTEAAAFGAAAGFVIFASYNITTITVDARWVGADALCDTAYGVLSWTVLLAAMHTW